MGLPDRIRIAAQSPIFEFNRVVRRCLRTGGEGETGCEQHGGADASRLAQKLSPFLAAAPSVALTRLTISEVAGRFNGLLPSVQMRPI